MGINKIFKTGLKIAEAKNKYTFFLFHTLDLTLLKNDSSHEHCQLGQTGDYLIKTSIVKAYFI